MSDWRVLVGDCVEAMAAMEPASVDAIVTDPPYGLEFMGKEWDRLDTGLPQENVWKGRRGKGGSNIGTDDTKPASRHHVTLGAGKKHAFHRCTVCGKRQFSGSPCACPEPEWVIEYPDGAPSSSIRMQRWHEAWAREALRVLKPGGHLLAFGGTRTSHRLVCAIEDAGFEIRDTIAWMYGSGFPKSLDVSKAIDKAAGAEREVIGMGAALCEYLARGEACPGHGDANGRYGETVHAATTAPATPDAEQWQGWGTALKPSHEPIVVARKPLDGTVAATVLRHGTGAINVDGCRVGRADGDRTDYGLENGAAAGIGYHGLDGRTPYDASAGRWPANVVFDEEAARLLDEQTGTLTTHPGTMRSDSGGGGYGSLPNRPVGTALSAGDSGGASRFFYVAKASSAERNAGLDGFEEQRRAVATYGSMRVQVCNVCGRRGNGPRGGAACHDDWAWHEQTDDGRGGGGPVRNSHPTVKPIALMRWLVRLVTPPGGTVLDPFAGSGTTGCAAVLEGFNFVGIEREAEYVVIAKARIAWWARHPDGVELVRRLEMEKERAAVADAGQVSIFDLLGEAT